jgi:signal transduction histidine kinase/CheY-like chemotaxis protein
VREARIAERTDALCLKHMLGMGRQSYILLPSVLFIAWLAVREGAVVWAGVWFVAWVARMVYVFRLVGQLRRHPDAPPGPALRAVVKGYVFAGLVAGGLLPVFFMHSNDMVLVVVTFLVTIYGSTMMTASSGVLRAGLGYGMPTLGVLVAGWLWHGGLLGYGLAAFLALSLSLSIVAIRSQRKALTEVVRVIDDNERLSAALARERDRTASVSESKTRFFAAASHDLRQPLHALSINATTLDLIARRSGDEVLKEVSQGIGSALRQSRGLLDGLLDISRLDANAVQTRMAPHNVRDLLAAVRDEYAALASQRGLCLRVEVDEIASQGGLWVTTDADQLLRILGNLVDNAIKFTREGTVSLSAVPDGSGRVLVRVIDTGPGIAECERERVFEEFYQVGNPSRDRSQGLGLGLAIVQRTAVLLGASLSLVSQPGIGAAFELSLPAAAAAAPEAPPPPRIGGERTSLSVLLVDDEPALLIALCTYLQQLGWQACGVASGTEAMQMLNDGFRADVVVIDYRLRDETGVDVMHRLRAAHGDLRFVIVTGDIAATRLRELSALGVLVLHKPVDGERLAHALLDAADLEPAIASA